MFGSSCEVLDKSERTVQQLGQFEDGFIIWHEYVVPRIRAMKKVNKTNKGKNRKK